MGWGTYKWSTGATTETLSKSVTADAQYTVEFKNQGGAVSTVTFDIKMLPAEPYVKRGTAAAVAAQSVVTEAGQPVTLGLTLPTAVKGSAVTWSTGDTGATLTLDDPQTSATYTATFTLRGQEYTIAFEVFVDDPEAEPLLPGAYLLRDIATGRYLTAHGSGQLATFEPAAVDMTPATAPAEMRWWLERSSTNRYGFVSLADADSLRLTATAKLVSSAYYPFYAKRPMASERIAFYTGSDRSPKFWGVDPDGTIVTAAATSLSAYPFEHIPIGDADAIRDVHSERVGAEPTAVFDLLGRKVVAPLKRGSFLIINGRKVIVK